MTDSLVERISKLLSLAGNNPSEEEANAAAEKAAAMMLEHGVTMADIAAARAGNEQVHFDAEHHFMEYNVRATWKGSLAHVIASNSGGRVVRQPGAGFHWYGSSADHIESMIALFHFLEVQFELNANYAFAQYKEDGGYVHGKTFKHSYRRGLATGLNNRLKALQGQGSGTGLVLLKDALDRKVEETLGRTTKAPLGHVDVNSYRNGVSDAKNLDLNFGKVGKGSLQLSA